MKANEVNFGGESRKPEYAILMPNRFQVLCRAGASLGLSTIIRRKEADKKGVNYLVPIKWDQSDLYIYPNKEVRNKKGQFVGEYLGHQQDSLLGGIIGSASSGGALHDIYIRRGKELFAVDYSGGFSEITPEEVVNQRLHWTDRWNIAGRSYPEREEYTSKIEETAEISDVLLRAALKLRQLRRMCPEKKQTSPEVELRQECERFAHTAIGETAPSEDAVEELTVKLMAMSEEDRHRFCLDNGVYAEE